MTNTATPPAPESRVPTDAVERAAEAIATVLIARWRETDAAAGKVLTGDDARDMARAALATFDQAVPSAGVDGLVERIKAIIEREVYVCCDDDRAHVSLEGSGDAALAIAALFPVPASAYPDDGGLGPQKKPLNEAFNGFAMIREALTKSPPQETIERP